MYSRISSGDIPGDEQNTNPLYMDYPDGLPLSFLFLLVAANTSVEIQAIILTISSK